MNVRVSGRSFAGANGRSRNRARYDGVITDGWIYNNRLRSLPHACIERVSSVIFYSFAILIATAAFAQATATPAKPAGQFEPRVGQPGKDVVWVPTPQALVDKMLDMAKVTPSDFVMDLGSGDGRTVITAAKRGATAMGIEYNPDMVELSKRNAQKEGVTAKATFVQADLFKTDLSKATVITMFLLPEHQHAAAAVDPQPEAGHAHRREHLHDGRLGSRRNADGDRQLLELVHGAAVDRAGKGAGHVEDAAGQPDADAGVSELSPAT